MNHIFKTILLWLLMLVLPAQGFAAAFCLSCGSARSGDVSKIQFDKVFSHKFAYSLRPFHPHEKNMSIAPWMAIAALAILPLAVSAQDKPKPADPTNPAAAVAPLLYESAFAGYQTSSEPEQSPDKNWRAINDEMSRLGGHAGHTKEAAAARGKLFSPNAPTPPKAPGDEMPKSEPMPPGHSMKHKSEGQ